MSFGEKREGSGGFTVSFATIANTVAALALAGICGAMWGDHTDLINLKDQMQHEREDRERLEGEVSFLKADAIALRAVAQETKDAKDDAVRRLDRDDKLLSDLDQLLRPPRH